MTDSEKIKETQAADEKHHFDEYGAIVKALQPYIQGAKTGNGNHIRTAFYDHAQISGSLNGNFQNLGADGFKETVNEMGSSPDIQHQIAWIEISGPAAAVKIEFMNWLGFRFTDFLILFKHNKQWKISGKVYDAHSKN